MVQPLLIKNGRILDPTRNMDAPGDLLVAERGILVRTGGVISRPGYECTVIDAAGLIVCPGFIDMHCHLRQPGYEEKETIATGTRAAAKGGFTTVCCMPNTIPPLDGPATIRFVTETAAKEGMVRVLPNACVTKGRKGQEEVDFKGLAAQGIAGFSDDGSPVYDEEIMRQALIASLDTGLPVIEHCEVPELAGDGVMNEGAVSARLGLKGIPAAAEEDMVARDIGLARQTGGWVHIAHASTAGSVQLIRQAKAEGVRVTAEVTPHHLTLTEDKVTRCGTRAKVNPPLRTQDDIRALIESLNDGTIDVIATDHAPHTEADKAGDMTAAAFGFSGFETAFGSLMGLVHGGYFSLELLIDRLTRHPALLLGEGRGITGTLAEGSPADIVIVDPDREWTVNPADFVSKGKNTPLAGTVLKGKVMATVAGGKVVWRDNDI